MRCLTSIETVLTNIIILALAAMETRTNYWLTLAYITDIILVDCIHIVDLFNYFIFAASFWTFVRHSTHIWAHRCSSYSTAYRKPFKTTNHRLSFFTVSVHINKRTFPLSFSFKIDRGWHWRFGLDTIFADNFESSASCLTISYWICWCFLIIVIVAKRINFCFFSFKQFFFPIRLTNPKFKSNHIFEKFYIVIWTLNETLPVTNLTLVDCE